MKIAYSRVRPSSAPIIEWEVGGGTIPLTKFELLSSPCVAGTSDDFKKTVYWKCPKCGYSESEELA